MFKNILLNLDKQLLDNDFYNIDDITIIKNRLDKLNVIYLDELLTSSHYVELNAKKSILRRAGKS